MKGTPSMIKRYPRAAVAVIATALIVAFAAPLAVKHTDAAQSPLLTTRNGVPSLAPLVDKVAPAVVNVGVKATVDMAENPLFNDPLFRFFGGPRDDSPRERRSSGSGVIVDADKGYVITNHHVIDGATEISIRLRDRRTLTAEVVGSDEGTDIALLKIDADNLTELPIGNSQEMKVGDYVIAVGNPFGLTDTVTTGIISALGRSGLNIEGWEDFIQTDASINPGNSGGALVNLHGELIGINTAIIGPSGGNVGIGFAVPTAMVESVVAQLIEYGEVRRGQIGVLISNLNPELAESLGVDETEGALISRVQSGSPAEAAGLKAGDIVTKFNRDPLEGSNDLRNKVGMLTVGTTIELTVIRDGKERDINVTIGKAQQQTVENVDSRPSLAGAAFANPDSDDPGQGVIVTNVERGSPAYQVGLRTGDVIVSVNRQDVADVDAFTEALSGNRQAALFINRNGEDILIVVQ
jgi:Do/DeqQ family serine protease